MNWFSENKIFSSFLVAIAVAALALAYLTFSASSQYTDALATYQAGIDKLTGLRGIAPFRNGENLKKYQDQVGNYKDLTDNLRDELLKRQGPIASIEPAVFQGRLRESVSKTIEHANQRQVQLPPKFYLGFEKYENELPRNDITGLLSWELTAIESIVNRLIDLKVANISSIVRPSLPGEINPEPTAKTIPLLRKYPFVITFQGYPGNLQSILNDLGNFPQFTVVRSLRITNEVLKSPTKPGAASASSDPSVTPAEAPVDKIIIGKEKVTASLIIDLVEFTSKTTPPTSKK